MSKEEQCLQEYRRQNKVFNHYYQLFESIKHIEDSQEYWIDREVAKYLGYEHKDSYLKRFLGVIEKAKILCITNKENVNLHFAEDSEMQTLPTGGDRKVKYYRLSRLACYYIAQEADASKAKVAEIKQYFALRTRHDELISQLMMEDARIETRAENRISDKQLGTQFQQKGLKKYGAAKDAGDVGFFTKHTKEMKEIVKCPENEPLSDYLHPLAAAGKTVVNLATIYKLQEKPLVTEQEIIDEHGKSGKAVRESFISMNIKPENLPAKSDIKQIEIKKGLKKIKTTKQLKLL
jgi:DNA-damage-inducible protein D